METKILIIRLSDTKDVLLRTPVIRQIRVAYPDAQIDFLTEKSAGPLLKYNPHLDFLFTVESSRSYKTLWIMRKRIRLSSYTHIFDLQNNRFSKFFSMFQPMDKEKTKQPFPFGLDGVNEKQPSGEQRPEIFWKDAVARPVHSFLKNRNIRSGYILVDGSIFSSSDKYVELLHEISKKNQSKWIVFGNEKTVGFSKVEKEKIAFTKDRFDILEKAILINMSRAVLTSTVLYSTIAQALSIPVVSLNHVKSVNIPRILRDLQATIKVNIPTRHPDIH